MLGHVGSIPLALSLALMPVAARAQAQRPPLFDRDSHFVQIDRQVTVPDRVRAICRSAHPTDYEAVIREQDIFVDSVGKRGAPASAWLGLACRRALLFAMGAPGREGPLMPVGTPWVSVAIDEAVEALTRDPANLQAAQLLAAIAFQVVPARRPAAQERERSGGPPRLNVPPAIVPHLASLIYRAVQLGVRDPGVLRACTSLMFDAGDTGTGADCSRRALALGIDSTWHLLRLTWLAVLRTDTTSAKQLLLAAVRSAHDAAARAELGWHLEDPCQGNHACGPPGILDIQIPSDDKFAWLVMADSAAERWFTGQLAVVARGDTTSFWRGVSGAPADVRAALRTSQQASALARRLTGHFLLLSYAGSGFRACFLVVDPNTPCWATLDPYDDPPIDVIAQVDHLWDPATGSPIDLLPYTIIGNDLAAHDNAGQRTALVDLAFRRWGSAGARDTIWHLSLALPPHAPKHPAFTGYLVVPTVMGLDAWSLMATQVELRHGGVYQDEKPPLDSGPLALSDLVLGSASQGLTWEIGGRHIALAPQGVVLQNELVQLYYQVKSEVDRASVRTKVTVFPEGADRVTATPAMQIAFDTPVRSGLNEIERELSMSRLVAGKYWFEIEVADPASHVTSRRSVLMYLR